MNSYSTSSYATSGTHNSYPYPNAHVEYAPVNGYIYGNGNTHYRQETSAVYVHHQQTTIYAGHGSSISNSNYPYPTPVTYSRHPSSNVAPLTDVRNAHGAHYATQPAYDDQLVKRNGRRSSINSGNPYPYPASGRRASQDASSSRSTRKPSVTSDSSCVLRNATGGPLGPSNHIALPQDPYYDETFMANYMGGGPRRPAISFQVKGFPELGARMSAVLGPTDPPLVGNDDKIFSTDGYKEIKLRLLWPGYSRLPFERRIKTRDSQLTRSHALLVIAKSIMDFIKHIQTNRIPVERGFEAYQIQIDPHKPGFTGNELFITGLLHRGGANWQPEIWCPVQSRK
ncbi:hypothetical protein VNI00_004979 [Paramarasmius palmivorus]|uniref:Uncharacterized protein n=1 Tax=Paramarasmius palmivorus TaxID=297713 RepID=A0AAW0DHB4_9AGAR